MADDSQQDPGSASDSPSRDELNAKAAELGVDAPERLKNIAAVEEAISDAEATPHFSRDEVLANARSLTGYSRNHMAGALYGDSRQSFTKAEATAVGRDFAAHEAA